VLVACYNEARNIGDTLTSLAAQDYPGRFEIIVLNDGSTDDSLLVAARMIGRLKPRTRGVLRLIDFGVNAGKSTVLNRGLKVAAHDLVATVDGDCWLRPDALRRIVERMLSDPPGTEAVAGAVLVRNSRRNLLTRAQEWDYFHGIAAVKRMQSMFHGTLVAQGAFSLYTRRGLEAVGGWPPCVGEDIVVTWALLKAGYRVGYAEDALVFTNVPHEFHQFARQRRRWSRGLIEAFGAHWPLLFKWRLSTLFIWWNLFFLPLDLVYTFAFIPGLILALFGLYWIAGPMTLAVLPLAAVWNWFIFRVQRRMFRAQGLRVRGNPDGFLFYVFAYSLLMQPVCVGGYFAELAGLRKNWGTK
jgi:biofilm PGA synthesis N-glycosyltransferase PgaC